MLRQNARSTTQIARSSRRVLRARGWPPPLHWALAATVTGWSLMWATALGLVVALPPVVPVAIFLFGLGLIPFSAGMSAPRLPWLPRYRRLARSERVSRV